MQVEIKINDIYTTTRIIIYTMKSQKKDLVSLKNYQ